MWEMSRKLSCKRRSRLRRHKRKLISWQMLSWKSKLEFRRCWRRCASKDLIDETAEAQRVLEIAEQLGVTLLKKRNEAHKQLE